LRDINALRFKGFGDIDINRIGHDIKINIAQAFFSSSAPRADDEKKVMTASKKIPINAFSLIYPLPFFKSHILKNNLPRLTAGFYLHSRISGPYSSRMVINI